jgi:hypothetical protein
MSSVLAAIQLHHQTVFWTTEVDNKMTYRMLSPEFYPAESSVAQLCPEPALCFCLLMA